MYHRSTSTLTSTSLACDFIAITVDIGHCDTGEGKVENGLDLECEDVPRGSLLESDTANEVAGRIRELELYGSHAEEWGRAAVNFIKGKTISENTTGPR